MTLKEFAKLKNQIEKFLTQFEKELEDDGIIILSSEYDEAMLVLKEKILAKKGLTLEEYNEMESKLEAYDKDDDNLIELFTKVKSSGISDDRILSLKDKMTGDIIVKVSDVESKLKEELKNTKTELENYKKELKLLKDEIDVIKKAKPINQKIINKEYKIIQKEIYDDKKLKEFLNSKTDEFYKKLITLDGNFKERVDKISEFYKGMPDFRRLGMGLQAQIDDIINGLRSEAVNLSSQCNGSTYTFTLPSTKKAVIAMELNGTILVEGKGYTFDKDRIITLLTVAPSSGEELWAICV